GVDFPSTASVAEFLAAALRTQSGVNAAAQTDGSILVDVDGGLTPLGSLKWTRVTPYDTASSPQTGDSRDHYIQVVINLTGEFEDVRTGDTFTIVLNGQTIKYVVPQLLQGPGPGERNLNTVAAGFAAKISSDSARYDAVADGTQIRIFDQNRSSPDGVDPIVFSA